MSAAPRLPPLHPFLDPRVARDLKARAAMAFTSAEAALAEGELDVAAAALGRYWDLTARLAPTLRFLRGRNASAVTSPR